MSKTMRTNFSTALILFATAMAPFASANAGSGCADVTQTKKQAAAVSDILKKTLDVPQVWQNACTLVPALGDSLKTHQESVKKWIDDNCAKERDAAGCQNMRRDKAAIASLKRRLENACRIVKSSPVLDGISAMGLQMEAQEAIATLDQMLAIDGSINVLGMKECGNKFLYSALAPAADDQSRVSDRGASRRGDSAPGAPARADEPVVSSGSAAI